MLLRPFRTGVVASCCWLAPICGCDSEQSGTGVASGGTAQIGGATSAQGGGAELVTPVTAGHPAAGGGRAGAASGGAGALSGAAGGGASGHGNAGASGATSLGGAGGTSGRCAEIEREYADALAIQLACRAGGPEQCASQVETAPGCDCRVFIEPKDPFAIETLFNLQADWFDADCSSPTCPATCPKGTHGACVAGHCAAAP